MLKAKTPSFVLELPLKASPKEIKTLNKRLEAARQLYNACLGELLKRARKAKGSEAHKKALSMPKNIKNGKGKMIINPERKITFKKAVTMSGFSEYAIHHFSKNIRKACHIKDNLDAFTEQKVATRAYEAVNEYFFKKRGKPRFKGINQMASVEGKSNASGIRFKDGFIYWKGLKLKPIYDKKDRHGVEAHGLACKTKYARLVKRTIKGKTKYVVQLIQEGFPRIKDKNSPGNELVGLDLGPSTIACVGETSAFLDVFCSKLETIYDETKGIQIELERSRRQTNPENYELDFVKQNQNGKKLKMKGKVKKRVRFSYSKNYKEKRDELSELNRQLAAYRKSLQGKLVNDVLRIGKHIKLEDISYKAWQKMFGKSIGHRAPGMFVEKLIRKAESAGGSVQKLPLKNRLSQTCHCGNVVKKSLSTRWHHCQCGVKAQRDLYSAFLAKFADNGIDISQAKQAWTSEEALLDCAMSVLNETAIGELRLASFGLSKRKDQRQSGLRSKGVSDKIESHSSLSSAKIYERDLVNCH